jgi:hypothetical protein
MSAPHALSSCLPLEVLVLQSTMMQHGPSLAASPPMRNNLEVGRRESFFLCFSAVGGQSFLRSSGAVPPFRARMFCGPSREGIDEDQSAGWQRGWADA